MRSSEMDYDATWNEKNDAGEGYPIGRIGDDINDLSVMGVGELVSVSIGPDNVAVYSDGRCITIVGDANGPWAVRVLATTEER